MLLRVGPLPDSALAAAAEFFERVLPLINPPPPGEVAARSADGGGAEPLASRPAANPLRPFGAPPPEGEDFVVLVFPPADHTHRAWRLAAVQGLAREHAPIRVNGVASDDEPAIAAALDYLAHAPGVTGQYWPLDAQGAKCA